jgi:DNA-3-methyladenine glycosylase
VRAGARGAERRPARGRAPASGRKRPTAGPPARKARKGGAPPAGRALGPAFFDRDAQVVACDLLGKVLCHRVGGRPLWAWIVEAEAYYLAEKASHASLGYTEKRRALFMPPGTIYMYYSRAGDSFNVSCAGAGNAVLVKAGRVPADDPAAAGLIAALQRRVPLPSGALREPARLCSGQSLLCRALGLRVPDWDGRPIGSGALRLLDVGARPAAIVRTTRMGIPPGRDGHLPYRFVDAAHAAQATVNPLRGRRIEGADYRLIPVPAGPEPPDWAALLGLPEAGRRARTTVR